MGGGGGSLRDILECPRFLTCPRRATRAHETTPTCNILVRALIILLVSSCAPPSCNYTPGRKGAEMLKEKARETGQTVKMNGSFATGLNHAHVTR